MARTELPPGIGKSVAIFSMVRPSERALLDARAVELQRSRSSVVRSAILAYLRTRNKNPVPAGTLATPPRVLVQVPVFNEAAVVRRVLEAVARLDYPKELLKVQLIRRPARALRGGPPHHARGLSHEQPTDDS